MGGSLTPDMAVEPRTWNNLNLHARDIPSPLVDRLARAAEWRATLNKTDQSTCFEQITGAVGRGDPDAYFFIQGAGGTGKTFLYRSICLYLWPIVRCSFSLYGCWQPLCTAAAGREDHREQEGATAV